MENLESILKGEEFFAGSVDTPKVSVGKYKKQECLKSAISKDKVHLLERKQK